MAGFVDDSALTHRTTWHKSIYDQGFTMHMMDEVVTDSLMRLNGEDRKRAEASKIEMIQRVLDRDAIDKIEVVAFLATFLVRVSFIVGFHTTHVSRTNLILQSAHSFLAMFGMHLNIIRSKNVNKSGAPFANASAFFRSVFIYTLKNNGSMEFHSKSLVNLLEYVTMPKREIMAGVLASFEFELIRGVVVDGGDVRQLNANAERESSKDRTIASLKTQIENMKALKNARVEDREEDPEKIKELWEVIAEWEQKYNDAYNSLGLARITVDRLTEEVAELKRVEKRGDARVVKLEAKLEKVAAKLEACTIGNRELSVHIDYITKENTRLQAELRTCQEQRQGDQPINKQREVKKRVKENLPDQIGAGGSDTSQLPPRAASGDQGSESESEKVNVTSKPDKQKKKRQEPISVQQPTPDPESRSEEQPQSQGESNIFGRMAKSAGGVVLNYATGGLASLLSGPSSKTPTVAVPEDRNVVQQVNVEDCPDNQQEIAKGFASWRKTQRGVEDDYDGVFKYLQAFPQVSASKGPKAPVGQVCLQKIVENNGMFWKTKNNGFVKARDWHVPVQSIPGGASLSSVMYFFFYQMLHRQMNIDMNTPEGGGPVWWTILGRVYGGANNKLPDWIRDELQIIFLDPIENSYKT